MKTYINFKNYQQVWNTSHIKSIPVENDYYVDNDDTIRYNGDTKTWELINTNEFYGPEGPQGVTGLNSNIGSQGPQGSTGITGSQGNIGPQGITGPQGNIGLQGPQGIMGPQGLQGNIGLQGSTGIQGIMGSQGNIGPQGSLGPQGMIGNGLVNSNISTITTNWGTGNIIYSPSFTINCERLQNIARITIPTVYFDGGGSTLNTQAFYLQDTNTTFTIIPSTYVPPFDLIINISSTLTDGTIIQKNYISYIGQTTTSGLQPGTLLISSSNVYNGNYFVIYGFSFACYVNN